MRPRAMLGGLLAVAGVAAAGTVPAAAAPRAAAVQMVFHAGDGCPPGSVTETATGGSLRLAFTESMGLRTTEEQFIQCSIGLREPLPQWSMAIRRVRYSGSVTTAAGATASLNLRVSSHGPVAGGRRIHLTGGLDQFQVAVEVPNTDLAFTPCGSGIDLVTTQTRIGLEGDPPLEESAMRLTEAVVEADDIAWRACPAEEAR